VAGARNRSAERAPVYMTSGSYCVPKSPQSLPTVYKPANAGDSDLINVRFGPLCGLTPDISRGP